MAFPSVLLLPRSSPLNSVLGMRHLVTFPVKGPVRFWNFENENKPAHNFLNWGVYVNKKHPAQADGILFHSRTTTASWAHPKDSLKNRDASC